MILPISVPMVLLDKAEMFLIVSRLPMVIIELNLYVDEHEIIELNVAGFCSAPQLWSSPSIKSEN